MIQPSQAELFERHGALPEGLIYRADFITAEEEAQLLEEMSHLPLHEASYKQWTAKRRIVSYGGRYDFSQNKLNPAASVPPFLEPLRQQIAHWTGIPALQLTHAMISEYRPGTQLGWHRDVPEFEMVVGVSLAGVARMRFRPYPPNRQQARATAILDLQPRSAYVIKDVARWGWQHAISPAKQLRYSVTFRTVRAI